MTDRRLFDASGTRLARGYVFVREIPVRYAFFERLERVTHGRLEPLAQCIDAARGVQNAAACTARLSILIDWRGAIAAIAVLICGANERPPGGNESRPVARRSNQKIAFDVRWNRSKDQ